MSKNYIYAIAVLIGTVVGAGIFSVPLVIDRSGLLPFFFYMIVLVAIQIYLHLMYAEIVLSTKTDQQLPGYVGAYTDKKHRNWSSIIVAFGLYGSLLAYIILGGSFLYGLLAPSFGGGPFVYSFLVFIFGATIVFFGIKVIASFEFFMTVFLVLVMIVITWRSFGFINIDNFKLIDWRYSLLPYGPVFFSVGGMTAIPAVCRLLNKEKKKIFSAIIWGTVIPAIITALFVVVIVGVTGSQTTPETLIGLKAVMNNGVVTFALIFGFLSIITSFLTISQAVHEIFWWDFKMDRTLAWALATFVPFFLFVIGIQNLTKVVSFTGAVTGGMIGVILIYLTLKVQKNPQKISIIKTRLSKKTGIALSSLFILGLLYSLLEMFLGS